MSDGWEKTDRGWRKVYSARPAPSQGNSDLACPRIITDTMPPTEHVDGKFYESKSAFRAVTKANGFVEVGNDPARLRPIQRPEPDAKARRQAVEKAVAKTLGA